ncbi:hypothetical protein D3C87_1966870 [compost metagenome]
MIYSLYLVDYDFSGKAMCFEYDLPSDLLITSLHRYCGGSTRGKRAAVIGP